MDLAAIADLPLPQASHRVSLRRAASPMHRAHLPPRASVLRPSDLGIANRAGSPFAPAPHGVVPNVAVA